MIIIDILITKQMLATEVIATMEYVANGMERNIVLAVAVQVINSNSRL
jgi:hypothetical protein